MHNEYIHISDVYHYIYLFIEHILSICIIYIYIYKILYIFNSMGTYM